MTHTTRTVPCTDVFGRERAITVIANADGIDISPPPGELHHLTDEQAAQFIAAIQHARADRLRDQR